MKSIKKNIYGIYCVIIVLVSFAFLGGYGNKFLSKLDCFFLLEERNPVFYDLFMRYSAKSVHVASEERCNFGGNYIISNSVEGNYYGIDVKENADGSITLNGKNMSGDDIRIIMLTSDDVILPNGNYVLSDGGVSTDKYNFFVYSDGKVLARLPQNDCFTINNIGMKYIQYGIHVAGNAYVNNVTFYPMISAKSRIIPKYSPYLKFGLGDYNALLFYTKCSDVKKIRKEDWNILYNQMKFLYKEQYKYAAIVFFSNNGDFIGKGIQFDLQDLSKTKYGKIDNWGIVTDVFNKANRLDGEIYD